jgi:hypothetical protein
MIVRTAGPLQHIVHLFGSPLNLVLKGMDAVARKALRAKSSHM